ncbi:nitroreductase family protein [Desertibacillus haloalkaliphilus]|nr:nitroreductase family protein [Desertibacillus haloalkaliphilus]
MDFKEVINSRREVTQFLDKRIPKQTIDEILQVGLLVPTGNHLRSREFIVVQEQSKLTHLAKTTPFMPWLEDAKLGIVITGRPDVSKYWLQDASIASGHLWLAAVNAGLGCAFGAVLNTTDDVESNERETYVRKALSIPDDRRVLAILGIGYEAEPPSAKQPHEWDEIIHYETFSTN